MLVARGGDKLLSTAAMTVVGHRRRCGFTLMGSGVGRRSQEAATDGGFRAWCRSMGTVCDDVRRC